MGGNQSAWTQEGIEGGGNLGKKWTLTVWKQRSFEKFFHVGLQITVILPVCGVCNYFSIEVHVGTRKLQFGRSEVWILNEPPPLLNNQEPKKPLVFPGIAFLSNHSLKYDVSPKPLHENTSIPPATADNQLNGNVHTNNMYLKHSMMICNTHINTICTHNCNYLINTKNNLPYPFIKIDTSKYILIQKYLGVGYWNLRHRNKKLDVFHETPNWTRVSFLDARFANLDANLVGETHVEESIVVHYIINAFNSHLKLIVIPIDDLGSHLIGPPLPDLNQCDSWLCDCLRGL
ncbi:hypothetical protein NQ318_009517 [Aromia moschata]|uniref:Uncharacterized protein n=1 Tax=Aromia moschata TaxID=1265417 RepID=A0AAV8Z959_9CUCU|nr:hypothetical protein NQ318_009517 [Aromia moschata]